MARFRKMRIDVKKAEWLLGERWDITTKSRPVATLRLVAPLNEPIRDYRTDIHNWPEMTANAPMLKDYHILFELLWPSGLHCSVDLADFYWDDQMNPLNPLSGFHIPELVKATGYPFHFPERVRAIPCQFDGHNSRVKVGVSTPNGVIFVECWSHFDEYDTSRYSDPSSAFRAPHIHGALRSYHFEHQWKKMGCNFVILPFGFEYVRDSIDSRRTNSERTQLYLQNAPKWQGILQRFFDGDDAETDDATETSTAATSPVPTVSATDEAAAEALEDFDDTADSDNAKNSPGDATDDTDMTKDPGFAEWLQDRQTKWHDLFWSDLVRSMLKECSVFLSETGYGVQLYTVANADTMYDDRYAYMNRSFKEIDGVWYQIESFAYCQKHYVALLERLGELQGELAQVDEKIQTFHGAFEVVQDMVKNE